MQESKALTLETAVVERLQEDARIPSKHHKTYTTASEHSFEASSDAEAVRMILDHPDWVDLEYEEDIVYNFMMDYLEEEMSEDVNENNAFLYLVDHVLDGVKKVKKEKDY